MHPADTELLSPKQLVARFPAFTLHGIRHLLFHRDTNGLVAAGAALTCGRKVLIRPDRFLVWLDAKNGIREDQP
jgi:hypothetical protein